MATDTMSRLPPAFRPPINRNMKELDRSFFAKTVMLAAAAPVDGKYISSVRQLLSQSHESLSVSRLRPMRDCAQSSSGKCILLRPEIDVEDRETWSPAIKKIVGDKLATLLPFPLQVSYDDWSMQEILLAILPQEEHDEIPGGFAQVGHVAHVNIRDKYLPYRHLIAQVLLDKNPKVTTVINKIEDVGSDNIFRTFPYEVLAGPDDMNVTVSHNDCTFRFNFAMVYWNTRLNTEHTRIMDKFKEGEAVCDVMAGVGPFAVPAGKRKVFVRANDLNPDSYYAMEDAITVNKVAQFVKASCLDGRDFIRSSAAELLKHQRATITTIKASRKNDGRESTTKPNLREWREPPSFDHYVMNLPASAVEFLDAFNGVYAANEASFFPATRRQLPMIHVYLFSPNVLDKEKEAQACCEQVSHHLGHPISPHTPEVEVFDVRLVSPKKKMFCVSFRLPGEVAFSK